MKIRTGELLYKGQWVRLCPHIQIEGCIVDDTDSSEYIESVVLVCDHCTNPIVFDVLVN